jgi:large subunit ribosomal protein L32e
MFEVMVHNVLDLEKINPKTHVGRISARVGKKKRMEIVKKAEKLKIKLLNA